MNRVNKIPVNIIEVIMRWVNEDLENRQFVLDGLTQTMERMSKEKIVEDMVNLPTITKENSAIQKYYGN